MKLSSPALELAVLRTICSGKPVGSQLLGMVNEQSFNLEAAKTIYQRIKTLTRNEGVIPDWRMLREDPIIPQNQRAEIKRAKPKLIPDEHIIKAAKMIKNYADARGLALMAEHILTQLSQENLEVDQVFKNVAEQMTAIKAGTQEAKLYKFGKDSNTDELERKVLRAKGRDGIPTGFDAWDKVNGSIARSDCMMIAGETGGFKSIVATNLGANMAEMGLDVAIGSFEMTMEQNTIRLMARSSGVNSTKIALGKKGLSKEERREVLKAHRAWKDKVARMGGYLGFYDPKITPTLEEFLYSVLAYSPDVIIIDYIALLDGIMGDDDWRQLAEAVRACKRFAVAHNILVIVVAQLAEGGESLRYSKRMLDDCDLAWFWSADEKVKESGIITVKHKKARLYTPITFQLKVQAEISMVRDVKKGEQTEAVLKSKNKKLKLDGGKLDHKSKGNTVVTLSSSRKRKEFVLNDAGTGSLEDL